MAGNVAGLEEGLLAEGLPVGGLLAEEFPGSATAGLAASGPDCARAEAKYNNPGISTAVKAS
jgi:hypothetical protein